jgi:hypothetical protein
LSSKKLKRVLGPLTIVEITQYKQEMRNIFKCLAIGLSLVMGICTLMLGKRKHLYASILVNAQCFKTFGDGPIKEVPSKRKKNFGCNPELINRLVSIGTFSNISLQQHFKLFHIQVLSNDKNCCI